MKLKIGQIYQIRAEEYLHVGTFVAKPFSKFVVLSGPQELRYSNPRMGETFYYVLWNGKVEKVFDQPDLDYIIGIHVP